MTENKTIHERLKEIEDKEREKSRKKSKKFKIPMKARVSKSKLRKGYVIVQEIKENKEVDFSKVPIVDGTIKLGDTFHAIDETDIFTHKGKPFLHLPKKKINAWNPLSAYLSEERTYQGKSISSHETYGQKYIMARMKSDYIKTAKNIGWGMSIFGLVIGAIFIYSFLTGG